MDNKAKITILGAGRWGSLLAWVYHKYNREVMLWNIEDHFLKEWRLTRKNKYLALPEEIKITSDFGEAMSFSDNIFISVRLQCFRDLCRRFHDYKTENKLIILAMKGLEEGTNKRPSEILSDFLGDKIRIGFMGGPGHPQEISQGVPTVMTSSAKDKNYLKEVAAICETPLTKIYPNEDLIGVEIGAATKNVIGIAGGILDALDVPSLKSYLLTRGPVEIGHLIEKLGGDFQTAFGLAHLGDYMATAFSYYSRNHKAGEMIVKEKKLYEEAEGVPTAKAVKSLIDKYKLDMPICEAVYQILYEGAEPKWLVKKIFEREMEHE